MATGKANTFGPRRRFKGKRGVLVRVPPYTSPAGKRKRYKCIPKSHQPATRPAAAGFECGQNQAYGSAHVPGQFKVQMPRNYVRYSTPIHPIPNRS